MNKILALAAATLMTAGLTCAAHAGPNCKPGAAPKVSAAKQAPAKSNTQAAVTAPVTAQGGGDGEASAPVAAKKLAQTAPKIVGPAVSAPQQIVSAIPASGDTVQEYTSVSGIAARLAALAAQQKAGTATE